MSVWDTIRSWFRSESSEARQWSDELQRDLSADLDRKEADLRATPAEKMERLQEQISANDNVFDEIKSTVDDPDNPDDPDTTDAAH